MNGAVQGVATTTASTPVKKAPAVPLRAARPLADAGKRPPISNTPERLRPTSDDQQAPAPRPRPATAAGSPSPASPPRAQRRAAAPASARNVTSTPARVGQAVAPHAPRRSPACRAKAARLHGQHREHAGHQVQDQPAQQREQQRLAERELLAPGGAASDGAGTKAASSLADDVEGLLHGRRRPSSRSAPACRRERRAARPWRRRASAGCGCRRWSMLRVCRPSLATGPHSAGKK